MVKVHRPIIIHLVSKLAQLIAKTSIPKFGGNGYFIKHESSQIGRKFVATFCRYKRVKCHHAVHGVFKCATSIQVDERRKKIISGH